MELVVTSSDDIERHLSTIRAAADRTKEWIAGFDLLDCASLDEAIAVAARHPMARFGSIELRPFWPLDVEEDPCRREARESGA